MAAPTPGDPDGDPAPEPEPFGSASTPPEISLGSITLPSCTLDEMLAMEDEPALKIDLHPGGVAVCANCLVMTLRGHLTDAVPNALIHTTMMMMNVCKQHDAQRQAPLQTLLLRLDGRAHRHRRQQGLRSWAPPPRARPASHRQTVGFSWHQGNLARGRRAPCCGSGMWVA